MITSPNTAVDLYCERTSAEFWAEPVNAFSNLSFIVAALAIVWLMRRTEVRSSGPALFLTINLVAIGLGSFLFHTLANRLMMLADLLPIFIYQIAFLLFYARCVAGSKALTVAGLLILFLLVNLGFMQLPKEWLNGSLVYGGALLFILAIAAYHRASGKREPAILYLAVIVFALALACRSLDQWICQWSPLGTHFLWHLLVGGVLYLTTRAYVLNQPPPHPSGAE
ncbi:ceramidase domain-containing protein [Dechloromonas sp. A34]|uniref:ceramidase domain-containing protein n=1 Tax=Dechloromonas sp. A34 TaxID=447588 RepID=UPI0022494401|nr:ceramidase domain-containing protein [Dechloromonas sp. A34]